MTGEFPDPLPRPHLLRVGSGPGLEAWAKLRAFIDSGATQQQVTEYARELGRSLPDIADPVAYAHHAEAVTQVVREILGDPR